MELAANYEYSQVKEEKMCWYYKVIWKPKMVSWHIAVLIILQWLSAVRIVCFKWLEFFCFIYCQNEKAFTTQHQKKILFFSFEGLLFPLSVEGQSTQVVVGVQDGFYMWYCVAELKMKLPLSLIFPFVVILLINS